MTEPLFHRAPAQMIRAGRERVLARLPGSGNDISISTNDAELLAGCVGFRSLEAHAHRYCQGLRLPAFKQQAVRARLEELARHQLLTSRPQVLRALRTEGASSATMSVGSVGIVTRNRPRAALACLLSFARHLQAHQRRVRMVVVDSSDARRARQLRASLARTGDAVQVTVELVDLQSKADLAQVLARAADVDPELLRFALLGDDHSGNDVGANRNTLLLSQAGGMFLSTDDDMRCELRQFSGTGCGLGISSDMPTRVVLHPSYGAARDSLVPVDGCVLDLHERALGKDLQTCCRAVPDEELQLGALEPRILAGLLEGGGSVTACFGGYYGDPGSRYPAFFLYGDPELREQLLGGPESYRQLVASRQIVRLAPNLRLGSHRLSMCGSVSLDARTLLPPFFPVMRGEDLVFGALVRTCFQSSLFAYLPQAVAHRPGDLRHNSPDQLWDDDLRPQMSQLFTQMIEQVGVSSEMKLGGERSLRLTGRYLRELAGLRPASFIELLRGWQTTARAGSAIWLEHLLDAGKGAPSYWANDLGRYVEHLLTPRPSAEHVLPRELSHLDMPVAVNFLQSLLDRYGRLLEVWPEVFTTACRLAGRKADTPTNSPPQPRSRSMMNGSA